MPTIGVIAEGVTDQQVLERFIQALSGTDEKPAVNFLQPANPQEPGNWDKVFKYVASERFRSAFQNNDFVVVHVDTDVCDRFTTPIARTIGGEEVAPEALIEQVKQQLVAEIERNAPGYFEARKSQILFAIAVHSVECWLLPLYCTRKNEWARRDNCLNLLNRCLSPLGFSIDKNAKRDGYAKLLKTNDMKKLKRDKVLEISKHNPGFEDFVAQMETLVSQPLPTEPNAKVTINEKPAE